MKRCAWVLIALVSVPVFAAEEKKEKPKEIKAGPPEGTRCVDPFGVEGKSQWSDGLKGWSCASPQKTTAGGSRDGRAGNFDRSVQTTRYDTAYRLAPVELAPLKISLLSHGRFYVSAEGGGGANLTCNRTQAAAWEIFEVIDRNGNALSSGDAIQLRTLGGQFIAPDISAKAGSASQAETFVIVKMGGSGGTVVAPGDTFALRAAGGKYLTAEGGGGQALTCNRTAVGDWEKFTYVAAK
jgi:hypothetical protein